MAVILSNAILWPVVVLGVAFVLEGTDCFSHISTLLGGGAAASVLVVGGGGRQLVAD